MTFLGLIGRSDDGEQIAGEQRPAEREREPREEVVAEEHAFIMA